MEEKLEIRVMQADGLEARAEGDGKEMFVEGYAAMFDKLSEPLAGFREKVRKGAFAESLRKHPVNAFWNHNPDYVLGSTRNGTLEIAEDGKGLRFKLRLPGTSWGRDAYESIRRGDVGGVSVGFRARADEWSKEAGQAVRTLTEARLFEISPTPMPAYPATSVSARAASGAYEEYAGALAAAMAAEAEASKRAREKRRLQLMEKEMA